MTEAELRRLAQIERQLVAEWPELRRMFDDVAAQHDRRRRRAWGWAAAGTLLVGAALLVAGLAVGLPGLAVSALCPPLALGVLLLGELLLGPEVLGRGRHR